MTNREKFKDELDNLITRVIAVVDGEPVLCNDADCQDCFFRHGCGRIGKRKKFADWLDAEYQEPCIDWSKVPIDTPVLASNDGKNWNHRYFAGVSGQTGNPMAYNSGATSWSVDYGDTCEWPFMKLAEGNE